jgi:hypothetical protein
MRAMLGKAAEKVGRVATILHCIHAAHLGLEVSRKIPVQQVAAAIKWVEYTTQQALSINLEVSSPDALESNLVKIISLAKDKGGTVSVREISKSFNAKYRPSSQKIREWLEELVDLKYGEITNKGQNILFSLTETSPASPPSYNPYPVRVTDGDTYVPTVSPPSPLDTVLPHLNPLSGDNWGRTGDTNVPTSKSLQSKGLSFTGDTGDVFTPSLEVSQPSTSEHTTSIPSSNSAPKNKTFEVGDRVVIAEVDNLHQGQHGEVVYVGYGSRETDYIVKLDKQSRGSKQVRVTVPKGSKLTFLMKL